MSDIMMHAYMLMAIAAIIGFVLYVVCSLDWFIEDGTGKYDDEHE